MLIKIKIKMENYKEEEEELRSFDASVPTKTPN